eukprot:11451652-Heterocapsa_arctica.AAC.1
MEVQMSFRLLQRVASTPAGSSTQCPSSFLILVRRWAFLNTERPMRKASLRGGRLALGPLKG